MTSAKEPIFVVVDSTVIFSDPRLDRAYFRVVRQQAARGELTLVLPEVVVMEVVAKFAERAATAYERMTKQADDLERLGLPRLLPDAISRAEAVGEYEAELRARASHGGCEIADIPATPHSHLVERAVRRRKPFSDSGSGYRDALIWETVIEIAKRGVVALITANTSDFCDDGTSLADDLANDLVAHGLPTTQVIWFPDLRAFIEDRVPKSDQAVEELRDALKRKPNLIELRRQISASVDGLSLDDTYRQFSLPSDTESPEVRWFEPEVVEVVDAHLLDADEIVVDLLASGEVIIDCLVPKWEALDSRFGIHIENPDWNEHYSSATAIRRMELAVTASYNAKEGSISNVEVVQADSGEPNLGESANVFEVRWSESGKSEDEQVRQFSLDDRQPNIRSVPRSYVYQRVLQELSELRLGDKQFVVVQGTFRHHRYDLTGTVGQIASAFRNPMSLE